jgi:hypothetical protein
LGGIRIWRLCARAIASDMTVERALQMPFCHPVIEEPLRDALSELKTEMDKARP